jgi:putative ribosome biogenesis GTPase RsgA
MKLLDYWPTREYIDQCIRTEAEELAEHTLLAVHEPMRLMRRGVSETISCKDEDLLSDFLQIERPIPIIGRSGVGKSHLIRWLHAKLKLHPEA